MPRMTRAEAKSFKNRWRIVNEFEIEELRRISPEVRLKQFFTLLSWARTFGWEQELEKGVDEVRQRWMRLRKVHDERTRRDGG